MKGVALLGENRTAGAGTRWRGLLLGIALLLSLTAAAQQTPGQARPARPAAARPDTAVAVSGSPDSLRVGVGGPKGDIETTVKYKAQDSIRFDVQTRVADLYREAVINYGDMNLEAARITVNYGQNLITAEGQADSTGKVQGRPFFKSGAEAYQAGRIAYNLKTKRGRITDAITQQGEGFVHAGVVKKNELNEIFGRNGRYTTCNLEHPHFFINASKMKVIPKEKVVTGPFNLIIGDIPTPLGFLFGYFPTPGKSRASGLIIPTFGQAIDRGFFLRNGGYYWAANEYIGVRVTGDIYSGAADAFGGWNVTTELTYRKRYTYDGRLSFDYAERPGQPLLPRGAVSPDVAPLQTFKPRTFWLNWSHNPVARPGGGRFSASVQTGAAAYNQQNSLNVRNYLTPSFNSSINYSKQLRNLPINYSVVLNQTLNTQTGDISATLPSVTLGVARQYFYDLLGLPARGKWFEQLSVGYDFTGQNRVSNTIAARNLEGGLPVLGGSATSRQVPVRLGNLGTLLRNSQTDLQHNFQIALGNYPILKHLNFTPSARYSQAWFLKRLNYEYLPEAQAVRVDTTRGFYAVGSYSAGASLQTNLFGTVVRKGTRKIQALRHRLSPSIDYSYSPNYTANERLYERSLFLGDLTDATGRLYGKRSFSRFAGLGGGVPTGTRSSRLSFGITNQVEMKVRNQRDTTGTEPFKKVSLLDGLDFRGGYDFAAIGDSLNWQPIDVNMRTQVAQKLNLNVGASFNLYQRDTLGRPYDQLLISQARPRLARLERANFNLTYQFDSNQRSKRAADREPRVAPANNPELGNPNPVDPYEDYVDFTIPWSLNASLNTSFTNPAPVPRGQPRPRSWSVVTLGLQGQLKLTDKMRIGYSTGYDFTNRNVSFTNLDFFRDLHCWQISGQWFDLFGARQGFNVTIGAKSSLLQDLKLNRNRTFLNR
ncbi:putative LPS assembly protein LptD [Hymenobacter sp. B81]|uniref:putative LPS assembly protein LptD n=1 Tax=Hymenobacter sp. B81 TaxID=3344878 RepID=UPI0037DC4545